VNMVRRAVFVVLLAVLLLPLVATADEQIPLKSVSDLKGNWSGSAGLGPFGSSATLTVQYTIKGDGTFTGVAKPRSTQEGGGTFQGSYEPKPDGSAGYATTGSTGTWRLFDVNGARVLRFEGRNRGGQPNWSEITQEK